MINKGEKTIGGEIDVRGATKGGPLCRFWTNKRDKAHAFPSRIRHLKRRYDIDEDQRAEMVLHCLTLRPLFAFMIYLLNFFSFYHMHAHKSAENITFYLLRFWGRPVCELCRCHIIFLCIKKYSFSSVYKVVNL